jgi:hypothetical protein
LISDFNRPSVPHALNLQKRKWPALGATFVNPVKITYFDARRFIVESKRQQTEKHDGVGADVTRQTLVFTVGGFSFDAFSRPSVYGPAPPMNTVVAPGSLLNTSRLRRRLSSDK